MEIGAERKVLDHGFVRLDAALADDLSVANSARVSFAQKSEFERVTIDWNDDEDPSEILSLSLSLSKKDRGLIQFLLRERHGTPFEHNLFRFHIKCPIFVAREWMRHRIGSFNEMSGRYTKLAPTFHLPAEAYTQVGKPGSYSFESMPNMTERMRLTMEIAYETAWHSYEWMLESGIAKELARVVLPVGIYTEFYWSVNARSLMNFLGLRCAPTAQAAIREYANVCLDFFKNEMPVTAQAFIDNGMVAP